MVLWTISLLPSLWPDRYGMAMEGYDVTGLNQAHDGRARCA